jgi:hypothetical protein
MLIHGFYQPRVAAPQAAPGASAPNAGSSAATTTANEANAPAELQTSELSQSVCESANRYLFIGAAGYDLIAVLVGIAVFVVMKQRLLGTRMVRYAIAIVAAGGIAAALLGTDPLRADLVARCINSPEFARYVTLGASTAARALALGVGPAAVVTLIACAIVNRTY